MNSNPQQPSIQIMRLKALAIIAIALFLLLGASFVGSSLSFTDKRWTPGWPLPIAIIFFFLAYLSARILRS